MQQAIVIVIYLCVLVGIGLWSKNKVQSRDGFFVAFRKGTTLLIFGSLLATVIGGSATIGVAGLGFKQGLTGIWWLLVGCIGLLVLAVFFAAKIRKTAVYSLPELVEKQYGKTVSLAAAVLIVIAWTGVVGGQIIAAGKILAVLGIGSPSIWMVLFTAVLIFYAISGGQLSVLITDIFQAVLLIGGIIAISVLVFLRVGGIEGLQNNLPVEYFSFPVSAGFGWKEVLSFLVLIGMTYIVGPDIYTRLFCSRDEQTARKATFLAAGALLPMALMIVFIGMSARLLYPLIPPEQALPQVIADSVSPLLGGLLIAALLAALMSSADSSLLSQAVILTEDILKRMKPSYDEKKTIMLTRLAIVGLGVLALGIALLLKGVISSLLFAYTIFSCGLVVPVIAGYHRERFKLNATGAMVALIVGGIIGLLGRIPGLSIPFKDEAGLIGVATSAVLLFAVSFLMNIRNNKIQQKVID